MGAAPGIQLVTDGCGDRACGLSGADCKTCISDLERATTSHKTFSSAYAEELITSRGVEASGKGCPPDPCTLYDWRFEPPGAPLTSRASEELQRDPRPPGEAPGTGHRLITGEVFRASEERRDGRNGISYLRVADGRGWIPRALCVPLLRPAPILITDVSKPRVSKRVRLAVGGDGHAQDMPVRLREHRGTSVWSDDMTDIDEEGGAKELPLQRVAHAAKESYLNAVHRGRVEHAEFQDAVCDYIGLQDAVCSFTGFVDALPVLDLDRRVASAASTALRPICSDAFAGPEQGQ